METTAAAEAQQPKKTGGTDFTQVPIIQCAYQLALETQKLVAAFPKNVRYQLGDRLAAMTQDFFEGVCKANFIRNLEQRSRVLDTLSAELFTIRMMIRMAKDLKTVSVGQFGAANARIEDIQKQLTGWTKWTQSQIPRPPSQQHQRNREGARPTS